MLLFRAYGVLLHRLSGQDDLVIGVAADAEIRAEEGGGPLFANTTHMMPLRCRIDAADRSPSISRARRSSSSMLRAPGLLLRHLMAKLNLQRDLSRSPLFAVTFNFEGGELHKTGGGVDFEWATAPWPYRSPAGTAMFELYLNVAERKGGCSASSITRKFSSRKPRSAGSAISGTLLGQIVKNPHSRSTGFRCWMQLKRAC